MREGKMYVCEILNFLEELKRGIKKLDSNATASRPGGIIKSVVKLLINYMNNKLHFNPQ
jgi:hypothetical protein